MNFSKRNSNQVPFLSRELQEQIYILKASSKIATGKNLLQIKLPIKNKEINMQKWGKSIKAYNKILQSSIEKKQRILEYYKTILTNKCTSMTDDITLI